MSPHLLVSTLLVLVAAPVTIAQERPAVERKRGAYVVKHAAAKDLAGILATHFKGAADIQAGPEGTSNCLLVSAPPAVFGEVMKTLEQLDHRPHVVAVEVLVVQLRPKKAEDKGKGPDEKQFSGSIDEVTDRLNAMLRKGEVTGLKRIQLTTLEGQLGSLMLGENRPYVTAVRVTPTGLTSKMITYRNLGTQVKVTPRVAADRSITLDLSVQDNRGRSSTTATVGTDEKGNPIPATEFILTSLTGKVRVASGKTVLAKDARVISKEGQGESLIVVGARIAEPEGKEK
jgi:type II secretory pathway component GspD/PulD (secretin)